MDGGGCEGRRRVCDWGGVCDYEGAIIRADGVAEWEIWEHQILGPIEDFGCKALCYFTCALTAPFFRRLIGLRVDDFRETNQ